MSKKKSLGHNPLAYSTRRHASFDFITPTDSDQEEAEKTKDTAPSNNHIPEKSPENNKPVPAPAEKPKKPSTAMVNKVTASYYLEEPLVLKIKDMAEEQNTSYSAVVNDMLKDILNS